MKRFTVFYGGDQPELAAEGVQVIRRQAGVRVIAEEPGLLLVSGPASTIKSVTKSLPGWAFAPESHATQPKPPRLRVVKRARV